ISDVGDAHFEWDNEASINISRERDCKWKKLPQRTTQALQCDGCLCDAHRGESSTQDRKKTGTPEKRSVRCQRTSVSRRNDAIVTPSEGAKN
ncbi:MAG: hypothetical protein Q8J97_12225, partial [Flavobacteriaceae bacterium]|nr:hypothetical protein [Flavobacteriaceae bacterium]